MDRDCKRRNNGISGVLFLFGLLALAYSVIVPYGESPDEPAHNAYIWYLLTQRELPHQLPDLDLNITGEGHHPPLYYAAVAMLTWWAPYGDYKPAPNPYLPEGYDDPYIVQQFLHPASEQFPWEGPLLAVHLARLVSIGMGVFSVWVTYQVARQLSPDDPAVALLAAGVHAFIPQFVFISSAVNNDNAAILLGSLITWQLLRLLRRPTNIGLAVLGVLMGLGMLSKISLLAMFPAVGWTVWRATAQRATWMQRLWKIGLEGALVLVPMLLVSGWWMWRNVQLYGDPLAWDIRMITFARFERQLSITGEYALDFLWQQFRSFWGLFGWGRVSLPSWLYYALLALTLLGMAGLVKYVRNRDTRPKIVLLLLVLGGLTLSSWGQGFSRDMVAAQGRFIFPALSATATLLALGWRVWRPAQRGKVVLLGIGALFALSVAVLVLRLAPVYARPVIKTLPSEAEPVRADFELWELVGWQAPQPVAGKTWPVTLYWRALRELAGEEKQLAPILFVHLVDSNGEVLAKWDGVPTQGRFPPPAWSPDVLAADTIRLQISSLEQARLAYLYVGFYFKEDDRLEQVPVQSSTHPTAPGTLLLGPVLLRPAQTPRVDPQQSAEASFGPTEPGAIKLLGFDLETGAETLHLTLYWQAEDQVLADAWSADYTVFVHLSGVEGLAAQGDAPPCGGQCPTSLWQAGDVWRSEHAIPVAGLDAGASYTLSVGWYDAAKNVRLPAFMAQGELLPENRLILDVFSIDFKSWKSIFSQSFLNNI